ncbi:MAG: DNA-binding protein, partial [Methanoregula sp.]
HALTGCLREKAVTYIVAEAVVLEFTGLDIRRQPDEKTGVSLPVHTKADDSSRQSTTPGIDAPPQGSAPGEKEPKKEEDMPGGLAEIIRDLTRRPRT